MSAIDRGFDSLSLSDSLREALRRRMRELTGVALIVFAMLLGLGARLVVGAGPVAQPRH